MWDVLTISKSKQSLSFNTFYDDVRVVKRKVLLSLPVTGELTEVDEDGVSSVLHIDEDLGTSLSAINCNSNAVVFNWTNVCKLVTKKYLALQYYDIYNCMSQCKNCMSQQGVLALQYWYTELRL